MRKLLVSLVIALKLSFVPTATAAEFNRISNLPYLTGEVDADRLKAHADSQMVPERLVFAIAWMETRSGISGNKARGPGIVDSMGVHHCREIGRMQLNPCVNWQRLLKDYRCSLRHIKMSYDDNVYCGIKNMLRLNLKYGGWQYVPQHYNGAGYGASVYQSGAESYLGHIALKELN